jgi:hypothetical protein
MNRLWTRRGIMGLYPAGETDSSSLQSVKTSCGAHKMETEEILRQLKRSGHEVHRWSHLVSRLKINGALGYLHFFMCRDTALPLLLLALLSSSQYSYNLGKVLLHFVLLIMCFRLPAPHTSNVLIGNHPFHVNLVFFSSWWVTLIFYKTRYISQDFTLLRGKFGAWN